MKKDDFKKSIDNINPDAYMGNRLKAKITTNTVPVKRNRQITLSIVSFCLAFAIIFGLGFISQTQTPAPQQNTTENTIPQNKTVNPFIMVASAANEESTETTETTTINKTLELNEEYPYEVYLKVKDIKGLSDAQISETVKEMSEAFNRYCVGRDFYTGRAMVCSTSNIVLTQCVLNSFKLDLKNTENIKAVSIKNTSKYGQMVYNANRPTFGIPQNGNDFTITADEYNFEGGSFYWDHTEELEKAFDENISTPFSTFNDIITFTVEYKDGSKAIGVVELVFDDSGNATAVCKNYDYVA